MASRYLHLVLSYRRAVEAGVLEVHRPAFLLGAVAPDLVAVYREKQRTHYTVHLGTTWEYRFRASERAFASFWECSPSHWWLYQGYRHHLLLDSAWLTTCGRRAVVRLPYQRAVGAAHTGLAQYYEMTAFDAFHRSSADSQEVQQAYYTLARADNRILPAFLDPGALDTTLGLLSASLSHRSPGFEGRILKRRDAHRFLLWAAALDVPCAPTTASRITDTPASLLAEDNL